MSRKSSLNLMVRLLSDPADFAAADDPELWKEVTANAAQHGLTQLVAFAARGRVPPREREWCDQVLTRAWRRHADNLANLEYILQLFEGEGIRSLVLKGPCLALRLFAPPFLRKTSGDLDLAVGDADLARACQTLERAGYSQLLDAEEALEFSHHIVLMHPVRPRVELHFRLSHGARGIAVDEFLGRAIPYRLPSGREVLIPDPADELLYLALHVASGRLVPFFHVYELHRMCSSAPREHLVEAVRRAERDHFLGAFWLIDMVFRLHWGEPFLPPEFPVRPPWLHWRINEKLYWAYEEWARKGAEHTLATRLWGRWLDLQTGDRPSDTWKQLRLLARFAGQQLLQKGWRNMPVGGVRPPDIPNVAPDVTPEADGSPTATPSRRSS